MKRNDFVLAFIAYGLIFLTGCSIKHTTRPEQFEDANAAYLNSEEKPPENSHLASTYPAPYSDVFQSASSSLALANLFPVQVDKNKGVILAQRTTKTGARYSGESRYFYRFYVKERGPESTVVDVQSKVQSKCDETDTGLGWYIATLGIVAAIDAATDQEKIEKLCREYISVPNWTDSDRSDADTLEKIHQMIRFNLIKAGLM